MKTILYEDGTEFGNKEFALACGLAVIGCAIGAGIIAGVGALSRRIHRKIEKTF